MVNRQKIKVAVLGANGQIGSVLIRRLSEVCDIEPIAICRNALGAGLLSEVGCQIRQGSITNRGCDIRLIADCDVVVNCIWPQGSAKAVNLQNATLLCNVRDSRVPKFISLSSVAVYGLCIDASWSTFDCPKPDAVYGESKLWMERATVKELSATGSKFHLLRLGHTYGHEQWLSRSIFEWLGDVSFMLPFHGRLPSNTIHVEEVAAAITALVLQDRASGILNLTSRPQKTWREVLDWHASVCGLDKTASMDEAASARYRSHLRAVSRKGSFTKSLSSIYAWLRSISPAAMLDSPDIRATGSKVLDVLPKQLEKRLKAMSATRTVATQLAPLRHEADVSPIFFCDAMPGPYAEVPVLAKSPSHQQEELLRNWHREVVIGPVP